MSTMSGFSEYILTEHYNNNLHNTIPAIQYFTWEREVVKQDEGIKRDWRGMIKRGENATTNLRGSDQFQLTASPGRIQRVQTWFGPGSPTDVLDSVVSGVVTPLVPGDLSGYPEAMDFTGAENRSLASLYSNLSSVDTYFKGMIFTGELRESLRMIKSPAKALRDGINDYLGTVIKRIPRRSSNRRKREIIADTWLEYAFGWKPLASDVEDAITAFYASPLIHPIFQMVRGLGKDTVFGETDHRHLTMLTVEWWYDLQKKHEYIVKHYGIYQSTGAGIPNTHLYGFRPEEFVPTIWELIPYSFLVDYFTNIGDILSSWSYRRIGLSWLARTVIKQTSVEVVNFTLPPNETSEGYKIVNSGDGGSTSARRKTFVRDAAVDLSIPTLEFEVPGMRSVKWLNLAALAVSSKEAARRVRSL